MGNSAKAETGGSIQTKRRRRGKAQIATGAREILLHSAGDWIPAESLLAQLVEAVEAHPKVVLNLAELDFVDASSLQVLVAAERAGWFATGKVELLNLSDDLKRSFTCAGAEMLLPVAAEGRL